MMRIVRSLIIVMGIIFLGTNLAYAKKVIKIEVDFPTPEITETGRSQRVIMKGMPSIGQPGEPVLPVKTIRVLVPFGEKVKGINITHGEKIQLKGEYDVEVGQEPIPLSHKGRLKKPTPPEERIYSSDLPFPGRLHTPRGIQMKKGYQVLLVNLHPIEYLPKSGRLFYYPNMTVEVSTSHTLIRRAHPLSRGLVKDREEIKGMVNNPEEAANYPQTAPSEKNSALNLINNPEESYQYVIITNDALKNYSGTYNWQALCAHKESRGVSTKIVTTEWIYANYSGTDNQEKIRNFIKEAYTNWGIEYVLLGGYSGIVPPRLFWVESWSGGYIENMPADMYYGCLDGSFNYDGDGKWAEPNDGPGGGEVDLYAEVYIGRACVANTTELSNFVKKTRAYETSAEAYLHTAYMVGEHLGFGGVAEYAKPSMEEIRLGSSAHGYTTVGFVSSPFFSNLPTLYDADGTWSKSQLISAMNSGSQVFNHLGHANYTYDMKLYTSDLTSLTNTNYFFAYSQGCMPGGFDTSNCFAEVITTMEHGAFAVVMNARYGWGMYNSTAGPSQYYDREFWDALFGENILNLGKMNQDSKEDNIGNINNSCMRWCYYELNLFGDPQTPFHVQSSKGLVSLDEDIYTIPAIAKVSVIDSDLDINPGAPDSTAVKMTSTTESAPETITLTETGASTKTFTGSINLAIGSPASDGVLQVSHGDTITATYYDADDGSGSPTTVTDTATIDAQGPVISAVYSVPGSTGCTITWTTDENSDSTIRYGTTPELGLTKTDSTLTTSHSLKLTGLSPLTLYYFDVVSIDAVGNSTTDDNDGAHYQFTTLEVAPILFVDDDEGDNYDTYFTNALNLNGYSYDIWNVANIGSSPTTSDMSPYSVVIWNTGYNYWVSNSGLTSAEQSAISGYLYGGGRMFISGQDILYNGVSTSFWQNYLHLSAYTNDTNTTTARGVSDDPISDGMYLTLGYPFTNWADSLSPGTNTSGIFTTNVGGYPYCAVRYPTSGEHRIVFFAYPFEAISTSAADPNNAQTVMNRIISWLTPSVPPTVTEISPSKGLNTSITNVTISGENFMATPQAKIGTVACLNEVFINSTTLTATVPAGIPAGIYNVRVTNPDGGSGILLSAFKVIEPHTGTVSLDQKAYQGTGIKGKITLSDPDLNLDPNSKETVNVTVMSTLDKIGITITLTETGKNTGIFTADLGFTIGSSDDTLELIKTGHLGTVTIIYSDAYDEKGKPAQATDTATWNRGKILLVDDDGGAEYEALYQEALDYASTTYDTWDIASFALAPDASGMGNYEAVMWFTSGQDTLTLTKEDQNNLKEYLNQGGNLALSSQGLLDELYGSSGRTASGDFACDYLHISSFTLDTGLTQAWGINGDPITDGAYLEPQFPFTDHSDVFVPDSRSVAILNNQGGNPCALRYPIKGNLPYQVVFFAFPLEAVPTRAEEMTAINPLVKNLVLWFFSPALPQGFSVTDPGTGGVLNLKWNPNSESDLAGYRVYYGTSSNLLKRRAPSLGYTRMIDVGNVTSYTLSGLTNNITYYVAVTAYDETKNESGYCGEKSGIPTLTPGGGGGAGGGGGGGGGGCLIATAAYGTPMAEEERILSEFRDRYLLTNRPGRAFISLYNRFSPPVARFIQNKTSLRAMVRFGLKPIVWVAKKAIH